ncbi:ABC transporter permease [Halobacillus naozhouensis]|uniref:FtsX-like permease family protein n=1 Tax=Halobacillus naozhouensis TaxID=554880 RepID=A0ABY8IXX5_9BACI|nr:FtsX-like permease family protein [Halobacillus naozhouensis]WFT74034.1 FtsX-like permease family protein [Halobacillus naozhouensis]
MNIVNKLTVRHLKENKRRTLVTIFGVIISVAMVTAVVTLAVSFLDLMKRQSIATDGEWHVQYENVNPGQIEAIKKDEATDTVVLENNLGYAALPDSESESKPYLFVKAYNEQGFNQFPIELSEGHLPENENEIVISEEVAGKDGIGYEIGDRLKLDLGKRYADGKKGPLTQMDPLQTDRSGSIESLQIEMTRTYNIVGIIERPTWEPAWSPGYTAITYVNQTLLSQQNTGNAIVVLNEVTRSLFEHAEKLAEQLQIESVSFNDSLLRLYGVSDNNSLNRTMYSLAAIIIAVIVIGSVTLIYNAFAISVSERARHLGMLSSVGATKKQKRNSVFFEGVVIGGISIPIGILAGLAGMAVTFYSINHFIEGALGITEQLQVVVTPLSIIAACVISMVTIFISTYLPARKASKVSAIDAIRQTQDIKLSKKKVKTSKLVRKIFGMEAEIGLKNLKRNKKRYQATVISLIISIVLFLTVSFFTENLKKSLELSQSDINYDIQVMGNANYGAEDYRPFTNLTNVTESSIVKQSHLYTWIEKSAAVDRVKENQGQDALKNGKYSYYVPIYGLDEDSFRDYAERVGADVEKLLDSKQPSAIVLNQMSYRDPDTGKLIEGESVNTEAGETIELYTMDYETQEKQFLNTVEIGTLTKKAPMGVDSPGLGGVSVIVSKDTFDQLIQKQGGREVQTYLYMNSSDPMKTQEALDEAKPSDMQVYNVYQNRQQDQQVLLLMSVFTYGFIGLISAISIANIFNTISTSISLRKREFAMLKSVGMTPRGFNKMINYESFFYGLKALLYGLPISIAVMAAIYLSIRNTFVYGFALPWMSMLYVTIAIFIIVSSAMFYSSTKIKKQNIIDALKQENI